MSESAPESKNSMMATWAIIFCTVIWGSVFFLTKLSVQEIPVFLFQGIRHLVALFGFIPFFGKLKNANKEVVLGAFYSACSSFFMLAFQTFGLKTTTAGKGAFIAALYIVLTPIFAWIFFKTKVQSKHIFSIGLTLGGMICLMLLGSGENSYGVINSGDFLIFIGAIFNALQIVLFEKYVKTCDIFCLTILHMVFVSLLSFCFSLLFQESFTWNISSTLIFVWLYMGLITTALTILIQAWAQKHVESTRAAIIFTFEAVFGTFFGIIFLKETITWQFIVGAGLIMIGILIASINIGHNKTKQQNSKEEKKLR